MRANINNLASISTQLNYHIEVNNSDTLALDREILQSDFQAASKTAISRKGPSAPLKILLNKGCIRGATINFGKGVSDHESSAISNVTGSCADYDFVHAPYHQVLNRKYDTVFAGYVLNVIPPDARMLTLKMVAKITKGSGSAFFAVRSNKETALKRLYKTGERVQDGVRSSTGTFQKGFDPEELRDYVLNSFRYSRIVTANSGFIIVEAKHSPFAEDLFH